MFTKENGKKLVVVVVGCLIALAAHQAFIAPKIAARMKPKA
ncbi:MAG: hypothetical protein BWY54_01024 [Candidatus Dependentiae bacterium ADurb.Bin331]|nr:MAG: hypothetical protein BWY54_01024 [Candidatus Dependentiae bacterium ADurb.Bin331]